MNTWLFLSNLTGIARHGVLKELAVCDLTKLTQHVNEMMAVAVKKNSEFLMVTFPYNQTRR